MTQIIVAIITGVLTLAGVIIMVLAGNKSVKDQTDLTLYRIEELEKKQDQHNKLIDRMYHVEDRCNVIDEKIDVANHRIDDLERAAAAH